MPEAESPHARAKRIATLSILAREFPSVDAASSEIARLAAILELPKAAIHVISDVHGEYKKLRHVINNASGRLRPMIETRFGQRLDAAERQEFLNLVFYPAEVIGRLQESLPAPEDRRAYAEKMLGRLFELVRELAGQYSFKHCMRLFPAEYRDLFAEVLNNATLERNSDNTAGIVRELSRRDRALHFLHLAVRVVRNLAIGELIIAGDCWDRGERGDKVVDYLIRQPNVSFTWGNHDAAWLGACLGQEACIAQVLRISLRYRRLSQLEEGYGITLQPLERLVRDVYANDKPPTFKVKGGGMREEITMRRMQKAIGIIQFKLEGQLLAHHPEWAQEHRRLMHLLDTKNGTLTLDGKSYPLLDTFLPTVDPSDPYKLSPDEQICMDRIKASFLASAKLWDHAQFVVKQGRMFIVRDGILIFHGCLAVDAKGDFLPLTIDGKPRVGRELMESIDRVVVRALEERKQPDIDLLWYLWCGPLSPLFGKDRITTLERELVADPATHEETKNPYFKLIHEKAFCAKVLAEFGVDPATGWIVNGHVPVKIEKGEDPVKKSGMAITIDGAFSEAYGDHGYTLVLEADRTFLAKHHHFESVDAALRDGVDIIPEIRELRRHEKPRRVADTERGVALRAQIELLEELIEAYRSNELRSNRTQLD
ncbi:MAG: fructose-bisphosphatase class III [Planctomycetes bacterium]|nr:fructose-bisphosphatase class III [Planctomycetota bacterium]